MNYRKAETLAELFWQKSRNPLTFWPRIILTLLIFIAFWSHAVWWIIFLLFVEAGIMFFAPPPTHYESWMARATDGFRIWSVVRSVEERNATLILFIFATVALLSAFWMHSFLGILFFGAQVVVAKLLLIRRFAGMARNAEYDIQAGLTADDLQSIASRCNLTN